MPTRAAKDSKTNLGSNSIQSNAFTPSNSSLLIVAAAFQPAASHTTVTADITITDSAGLTWTKRFFLKNSAASNFYTPVGAVWTAPVTTGASMTVTATIGGGATSDGNDLSVVEYTGHDTAATTTAPTTTAATTTTLPPTTTTVAPTTTLPTTTTTLPPTTSTTVAPTTTTSPACPADFSAPQMSWCVKVNARLHALDGG